MGYLILILPLHPLQRPLRKTQLITGIKSKTPSFRLQFEQQEGDKMDLPIGSL